MNNPTEYTISELAIALKAALRVVEALDQTQPRLDLVTSWLEKAEVAATRIADEIRSRVPEDEAEGRIRFRALASYAALIASTSDELAELAA